MPKTLARQFSSREELAPKVPEANEESNMIVETSSAQGLERRPVVVIDRVFSRPFEWLETNEHYLLRDQSAWLRTTFLGVVAPSISSSEHVSHIYPKQQLCLKIAQSYTCKIPTDPPGPVLRAFKLATISIVCPGLTNNHKILQKYESPLQDYSAWKAQS